MIIKCKYCKSIFANKSRLWDHVRDKHNKTSIVKRAKKLARKKLNAWQNN